MPTKKQLSKVWEQENEFPETRQTDDPLYKSPAIPKQKVADAELIKNIFFDHSFTHWNGAEHSQVIDVDEWDNVISELQKYFTITRNKS